MSPVATHPTTASDGATLAERIKSSKPNSVLAKTLPDEYHEARLAEVTKHRTRDGSKEPSSPIVVTHKSHNKCITHTLVRAMLHLEHTPGMLSLLAGKPHSSTFPITSLNFTVRDPAGCGADTHIALTKEELDTGLQYNLTVGLPPFLEWLYGIQKRAHGRDKGEGWTITSGNGSQDLIYKVGPGADIF